jgi:hypothetical protein
VGNFWTKTSESKIPLQIHQADSTGLLCTNTDAEVKDVFYDQIQATMECIREHDMVLILGDLSARVGCENTGREHVMDKHRIGTINNNGEKLVEFCEENNLLIGGTLFQHKYQSIPKWDHQTPYRSYHH